MFWLLNPALVLEMAGRHRFLLLLPWSWILEMLMAEGRLKRGNEMVLQSVDPTEVLHDLVEGILQIGEVGDIGPGLSASVCFRQPPVSSPDTYLYSLTLTLNFSRS